MGRTGIEIKFEFPNLLGALNAALPRIERVIASTIQTNVGLRFDNEGAHNGHEKWAPIRRQGQILSKTGTLRRSYAPPGADGKPGPGGFVNMSGDITNALVEVGSKIAYAGIHDRGGVIKWPGTNNGFGRKIKIPAHDIPMPKRNVTDLNQVDEDELNETITNLVAEILENA